MREISVLKCTLVGGRRRQSGTQDRTPSENHNVMSDLAPLRAPHVVPFHSLRLGPGPGVKAAGGQPTSGGSSSNLENRVNCRSDQESKPSVLPQHRNMTATKTIQQADLLHGYP